MAPREADVLGKIKSGIARTVAEELRLAEAASGKLEVFLRESKSEMSRQLHATHKANLERMKSMEEVGKKRRERQAAVADSLAALGAQAAAPGSPGADGVRAVESASGAIVSGLRSLRDKHKL